MPLARHWLPAGILAALTVWAGPAALAQEVFPNPPYQLADLTPVTMLALFPIAYGVNTSLEVNSLAELIALAAPDVAAKIDGMGFVTVGNSAEVFGELIKSEFGKWESAIRENQIKLE